MNKKPSNNIIKRPQKQTKNFLLFQPINNTHIDKNRTQQAITRHIKQKLKH